MTQKLIIFGSGEIAEVAHYYFTHHSDYEVTAFCLDQDYITEDTFLGKPVLPFETVQDHHKTDEHHFFISMGYKNLNQLRADKYQAAKNKGYEIASYISANANVMTDDIGENVFLLEDSTIQPFTKIGNNVTLWSGNHVGHHSIIQDHCFITSHTVISGGVTVGENSFVGVNATLRDHINIGKRNIIGAGAIILSSTEDDSVYPSKETEKSRVPSSKIRL